MLGKLALAGAKSRIKDYLVLFSGLVISSAIFYMFCTLAINDKYLKANGSLIKNSALIFSFGLVMLALITLVYIMYANNFLLSMRKKDYGLFMMLGAKKKKIGLLMSAETLLIGGSATVCGLVLGSIMSSGISNFFGHLLEASMKYYSPVYGPAILLTLAIYLVLFVIAAVFNTVTMVRKPALQLLHDTARPSQNTQKSFTLWLQAVIGIVILGGDYYLMANFQLLKIQTIPVCLALTIIGSYLVFNGIVIVIINLLRKSRLAKKGLNSFTLGQLRFRIHDYTKILTVVSLLFSLALGAFATGIGFKGQTEQTAQSTAAYSMAIYSPSAGEKKAINQLKKTRTDVYHYKQVGRTYYYNVDEFNRKPFATVKISKNIYNSKTADRSGRYLQKNSYELMQYSAGRQNVILSQKAYQRLARPEGKAIFFRVVSLSQQAGELKRLSQIETKRHQAWFNNQDGNSYNVAGSGQYQAYKEANTVYSGLEFMGCFLAFAFLAMLASCLMFKILSGASEDVPRYRTLNMIGAGHRKMSWAVNKEIGILFFLPGLLGIVNVLFGLQLFKQLMVDPYHNLLVPFGIFIVLYMFYYFLVSWMYRKIVLPQK